MRFTLLSRRSRRAQRTQRRCHVGADGEVLDAVLFVGEPLEQRVFVGGVAGTESTVLDGSGQRRKGPIDPIERRLASWHVADTKKELLRHGHGHDRRLHPVGVGFVVPKAKRHR